MTIRAGTPDDIPGIIDLLKASLGERLMPKTEAFWRWKHVDNPFGKSEVLLAFEGDTMVGLRVFMRWEWAAGKQVYQSARAVDTATHPAYQGKGIFRTLTLALVDKCKSDGADFVFNTPNKSSKPGYLKMGWRESGRLNLKIKPRFFPSAKSGTFDGMYPWLREWASSFTFGADPEKLTTRMSSSYLDWRYGSNPTIRYHLLLEPASQPRYAVVFRLKGGKLGTEFRICDAFLSEMKLGQQMSSHVAQVIRQSGSNFVSWNSTNVMLGSLPSLPVGPMVTVLPMSQRSSGINVNTWSPSVGDLEVF